jgi:hypothetical protein
VAIALDELEGCHGKKAKEERGVLVAGRRDSGSRMEERGRRPWGEQRRMCEGGEQVWDERAERLIFFADRWADGKRVFLIFLFIALGSTFFTSLRFLAPLIFSMLAGIISQTR